MMAADVGLLFDGNNPLVRPSKLSELWYSGKPVLAFCAPDGASEREVKRMGGVTVGPSETREEVAAKLVGILAPTPPPKPEGLQGFSREVISGRVAEILNRVVCT
jgi:hypothetical protein